MVKKNMPWSSQNKTLKKNMPWSSQNKTLRKSTSVPKKSVKKGKKED
jgi:hypothetical protein